MYIQAVKTIRLTVFEETFIEYFEKNEEIDPFFIFLIRDPRALMNSRLRISRVQYHETNRGKEIAEKVQAHCEKMSQNLDIISNNEFLKKRTIIVRYEDIALDPQLFARKMYTQFNIGNPANKSIYACLKASSLIVGIRYAS